MKRSILAVSALLALGTAANADYVLSDYATAAADSSAVNATYGAQSFGSAPNTTALSVTPGSLKLVGGFASSTVASDNGYTANLGLLHPIFFDWRVVDASKMTGVTFEIKTDKKPTGGWEFSFGSDAYTEDLANAGTVFLSPFAVPTAGSWQTVTVPVTDLAFPSWFCDGDAIPCPEITITDVLAKLKNLQIAPKTLYSANGMQNGKACTKCVTPTTTAVTFEIRNITLVGVDFGFVPGTGCTGDAYILDDFAANTGIGEGQNANGGYWYVFSDTSSTKPTDTATGSSDISVAYDLDNGFLSAAATLNKKVGGVYHKYAGWATVGTGFDAESVQDLTGLTAISFSIAALPDFDAAVKAVNFKVELDGIANDRPHMVSIPTASFASDLCVDVAQLEQASWVKPKDEFNAAKVAKLAWEMKITDQATPSIFEAKAGIKLTGIKLYGAAPKKIGSGVSKRASRSSFQVAYQNGALLAKGLEGFKTIEVVDLKGATVASFKAGTAMNLSLRSGTYLVVAKSATGAKLSRTLAVFE